MTAAPDDGFACYYYSYDLATGGAAGVPHLLVAESSNDQERYTSLIVHHPDDLLATDPAGSAGVGELRLGIALRRRADQQPLGRPVVVELTAHTRRDRSSARTSA